ncbi:hydroxylase [Massilia niabensis]|uniref:Hydroxylase n=1 Tax=Massilia niabensis TaxID=544910 RepID=A0ABW0KYZ4_9BURK
MHPVRETILGNIDSFVNEELPSNALGRVTDEGARLIRDSGLVRMLQPKEYGGFEADPREFYQTVMDLGSKASSLGWVGSVVGVHPFQFGQGDPRMQEEVWGQDHDTWTASPYAPIGKARRVDGGYILSGQWPFSSGTDHCTWAVLGGFAEGDDGVCNVLTHFVLPRADYEILQDSWNVMGLQGTGSKDVLVKEVFVPGYRTYNVQDLNDCVYATRNRPGTALYQIPFDLFFPGAISAATMAIAAGVVNHFAEYTGSRVTRMGASQTQNPYHMATLGAALADIDASRQHVLGEIGEIYKFVQGGGKVTKEMKYKARVNQVRAVRRAANAAAEVFKHAGGNASRVTNPIQRTWRDLSVAMGHACNVDDPVYAAYAGSLYGVPVPRGVVI